MPPVIRIHPNMAEVYRLKVAELEIALNDDSIKAEAGDVLRTLIDRVVLTPAADAPDGIEAQLHGDLVAILALSNDDGRKQKLPAVGVPGVYCRWLRGPATTFTEQRSPPSQGGNKGSNPLGDAN